MQITDESNQSPFSTHWIIPMRSRQHLLHWGKCSWPGHCAVWFVTRTIRWPRSRTNGAELFGIAGQWITLADHLLVISWRVIRRHDSLAVGTIQGMMMFEVPLEWPSITVAFATVLVLAFEWFLCWMSQNVAIPVPGNKTMALSIQCLSTIESTERLLYAKGDRLWKQFNSNLELTGPTSLAVGTKLFPSNRTTSWISTMRNDDSHIKILSKSFWLCDHGCLEQLNNNW